MKPTKESNEAAYYSVGLTSLVVLLTFSYVEKFYLITGIVINKLLGG